MKKANKGKTKNQHYVPKAYLRYFSRKVKNDYYIGVMDKNKQDPFMTNIENIATYRYFYEVESKPDNYWEDYYSKNIETTLPIIFNNIIVSCTMSRNNTIVLDSEIKKEMCKIILSQVSRTRKSKEYFENLGKNITSKVIDTVYEQFNDYLTKDHKNILEKYRNNKDFIRTIELNAVNSNRLINKSTYYLLDKVWVIYKNLNHKKNPFITSDHPVVYSNLINKNYDMKSNGIGDNRTVILFPLNRELLLAIYPKHMLFEGIQTLANMVVNIDEDEFILRVNRLQYLQCYKQVYYTFYDEV